MKQVEKHDNSVGHEDAADIVDYVRLGVIAAVIVFSLTDRWKHFMTRDWLAFAATLFGGWPVYKEAWGDIRKGAMTMEHSLTIPPLAPPSLPPFFPPLV